MSADQSTGRSRWDGSVPRSIDPRLLALVVVLSGLAASVNVPYGGLPLAVVAFVLLAGGGIAAHVHGQRRLRRITTGLAERWDDHGGDVEAVERASNWTRTTWVVHTAAGPVTISGLALAPLSKVAIEWQGTGDVLQASAAEDRLDSLATEWYQEIVEIPAESV